MLQIQFHFQHVASFDSRSGGGGVRGGVFQFATQRDTNPFEIRMQKTFEGSSQVSEIV